MSFAPAVQKLKNEGAYAVLAAATALEQQGEVPPTPASRWGNGVIIK